MLYDFQPKEFSVMTPHLRPRAPWSPGPPGMAGTLYKCTSQSGALGLSAA